MAKRRPLKGGVRVAAVMLAVPALLVSCAGVPAAQDVVIDTISAPGWEMVLDSPMGSDLLGLAAAVTGRTYDETGDLDAWMRGWAGEHGSIVVLVMDMGGPAKAGISGVLQQAFAAEGYGLVEHPAVVPGTFAIDLSDETGPAVGVAIPREAFFVLVVLEGDVPEALARGAVEKQLAAIPEYDPAGGYRPWLIGGASAILAPALWFAIRASRRGAESAAGRKAAT